MSSIKSGLVGILSAGLLGAGCADQNNHTSYGPAFFGTVAKVAGANLSDPRAAVNSAVVGDALYLKSTNDNRIDAARVGRDETKTLLVLDLLEYRLVNQHCNLER